MSLFLSDMPGTEFIRKIRGEWPESLPILLIPEDQSRRAVEALEAGASGYLPTPCPAEELIRAIWTVHEGGAVLERPVAKTIVDYFRARGAIIDRLTERQRQVLTCLSNGLSQAEIVAKLHISKETVRTHVRNVLAKLCARSTTEAIAFYLNPKMSVSLAEHYTDEEMESQQGKICPFPSPSRGMGGALSIAQGDDGRLAGFEG